MAYEEEEEEESFEGVPVDLARVEATIRDVEKATSWSFALPGRIVIHQLFVSLGMDQGGFAIPMPPASRQQALQTAKTELPGFLNQVVIKSKALATSSGYQGQEVGFPVVVHEMDRWARHIKCSCWPK